MTEPEEVPDLYRLAYMPGQFRCPKCSFQWSIQTINVVRGEIGTTEANRQTPDCPNDGTRMVCVTYREQLEAYADRLKEEFDNIDLLKARIAELEEAAPSQPHRKQRFGATSYDTGTTPFPEGSYDGPVPKCPSQPQERTERDHRPAILTCTCDPKGRGTDRECPAHGDTRKAAPSVQPEPRK